MKYLQGIASVLIPLAIGWTVMYMISSFINASWTITEWTAQSRIVCAIWSCVFSAMLWFRLERTNDI